MSLPASEMSARDARRRTLLSAATLAQFGVSFTQQGLAAVGIFFVATYHLTLAQMGTVISTGTLGLMISGLFSGMLVDRVGPRVVVLVGTLVMGLLALSLLLVGSFALTWALLLALGISLGAVPPAGTKAVLMAWPRERRGLPMGIRQMGVPAGSMAAALVLPALAAALGLRAVFVAFAALLLVCGLAFAAVLPPGGARAAPRASGPRTRLRDEVGAIWLPAVSGALLVWGQYALLSYTIPMLHSTGLAVAAAGAVLAVAQLGGACGRIGFGFVSDRLRGRRDGVISALGAAATLLAALLWRLPSRLPLGVIIPLWFALGLTMVGWNALAVTWAGERVSPANAGAAMSLTMSTIQLGATLASPLFGLMVERTGSYQTAWLGLAGILALATLLLLGGARGERLPAAGRVAASHWHAARHG